MKRWRTPEVVPFGGLWRWKHPETGAEIWAVNGFQLLDKARQYCRVNNLPIGVNFDQRIIDDVCAQLPDICVDNEPPSLAERAASFMRSATQWASNGFKCVSHEDYEKRLETCRGCERWSGEALFGLGRCGKCGCSGVKLYMDTEKCPLNKWPV